MNIMELGAIGELVGGIAVVASFVFVGLQIRHNTEAVRSSTQQSLHGGWAGPATALAVDPNEALAKLVVKGRDSYGQLEADERLRFDAFAAATLGQWETSFYQYQKRMLEPELWTAWDAYFREMAANDGYRDFWSSKGTWYFQGFQKYVGSSVYTDTLS